METCYDRSYKCCEKMTPAEHLKAYGYFSSNEKLDIFGQIKAGRFKNTTPYSEETHKEWQETENSLYSLFMDTLADDLGITNHPKKDIFLSKCWERGHSSGYSGVASVAYDLIEIL